MASGECWILLLSKPHHPPPFQNKFRGGGGSLNLFWNPQFDKKSALIHHYFIKSVLCLFVHLTVFNVEELNSFFFFFNVILFQSTLPVKWGRFLTIFYECILSRQFPAFHLFIQFIKFFLNTIHIFSNYSFITKTFYY